MRLVSAFQIFFKTLFNKELSAKVDSLLKGEAPRAVEPPAPKKPVRSEALTLLASLQREARFLDFVQENLDGYADAQIGAAARDVHRESGKVLKRLFEIEPILDQEEGATVTVPENAEVGTFRFVGNVTEEPKTSGKLVHHGWKATKCELPEWTGNDAAARIIAAAEIELS